MSAVRIAYQGEPGAFSEEAILGAAPSATALPCPDFGAVARTVLSGGAEYGLLPVENSTAGGIADVYDLLAGGDLVILDEFTHRIPLCLAALPGTEWPGLRRILSHPVALSQCTRFLARHPAILAQAVADTAGAARLVAESGDRTLAALAGRKAARHYGLTLLAEEVQDRSDNETRFYLVGPPGSAPLRSASTGRAVLLAETANHPGALAALLLPFADAGINLARLEARPARERWTYRFILELDTNVDEASWDRAVERAHRVATSLRLLGRFGRSGGSRPERPFETARIVGLGLIGGSIARELAARGCRVQGEDADAGTLQQARAEGIITCDEPDARAEMLILAIPPEAAPAWLQANASRTGIYDTVVDVGGTKQEIVATAARLGLGNFVGTHPLAGDHRSGWEASRLGLFQNATVYICPGPQSAAHSIASAERLWLALGARCRRMKAEQHDAEMAWTSHLPQLLASALALALRQAGTPRASLGPGGRDTTRLALSSPLLWAGAVRSNRVADATALQALQDVLRALTEAVKAGDGEALAAFLAAAQAWAAAPACPDGTA